MVHIEGPKGETLFWHLKEWLIQGRAPELQQHLDRLWVHYKDVQDERLLAIVGALCIEASLDGLLRQFAPKCDDFARSADVGFSTKISLARALCLIPSQVLNACDLVRQIRNDFAHNLEVARFQELDRARLDKLAPYVKAFNSKERDSQDLPALYRDMIGFTAMALAAYALQVGTLRTYLGTDGFRRHLKSFAEALVTASNAD
jgi:hypothetical protein